ncbi:MAG: penicillin-binding protein activator [Candidatus Aminicenantes bacterium]|nr:penicillin-binding protein activator [Candidatus Aminicenantes bacterium]
MKIRNISILIILIAFISLSIIFIPGCKKEQKADEPKVIKIGAILPLTGKMSFYGNEVKNGLKIAKEINKSNNISFDFQDNQSTPANSVNTFMKFSQDKSVNLIISCNSPLSIPLRPLAEKHKKVLLALVTGARDFGTVNKWSFRDAINQDQEGVALAKYVALKTNMRKGVTFVVNDDYGLGGAESFLNKFKELGGDVLFQETFEMNDRDMRSKILKLLEKKPDFIFLVGREETIITSINQIREFRKKIPIITSDAFDSNNVMKGVSENAKGIIFASYYNNLVNEDAKFLFSQYKKINNQEPGIYAIDAFVAGNYLIKEVLKPNSDNEKIRLALVKLNFNSTIKGRLSVDEKRNIVSPVAIYRVDDEMKKVLIHVVE